MTENSNGVVILITLLNILVYKLQKLQEAQQTLRLSLSVRRLCRRFTLRDMLWATNNFHKELEIGEGGFGKVYKGIIDFGENYVAIKRLKSTSRQGINEFQTEIEMLSKFQHSHLVSLIGYCEDREEMILVYEYMPRGTLADHLHKRARKGDTSLPPLTWEQRLKICIGAARGLDYLHTGTSTQNRVIHRDVKTSNILLDENLAAKISDFGLSKTGPVNQACTSVSTRVKGTPGYLDPYYVSTHRLTKKSDVYAFGVVLFEVLCGRPAVDTSLDEEKMNLAGWAERCFKEGLLDQIINTSIKGDISPDSLMVYVEVAIQCLQYRPKLRPSMAEIVVGLESALTLQEKSMHYSLVEITSTDYNQDADSQILETENTNRIRENESKEKGIINVSNGLHSDKQASRIAFSKMVGVFLSVTARVFSVNRDAKTSKHSNGAVAKTSKNSNGVVAKTSKYGIDVVAVTAKLKRFSLSELRRATSNFEVVLGKGGVGDVFKGWVLENTYSPSTRDTGLVIAVKRFKLKNLQGQMEWQMEMCLSREHMHPYIIQLLGYCWEGEERLLVYEYMPKRSADQSGRARESIRWDARLKILIKAARCLAFLHAAKEPVIYRDFKTSNIFLDGEFNVKLAHSGLARLLQSNSDKHATTGILGTIGYIAPEYAMTGCASLKTDVFAFGVVLQELVTGMSVVEMKFKISVTYTGDNENQLKYYPNFIDYVDPWLEDSLPDSARRSVSSLIAECADENPSKRPSMSEVVENLEQISISCQQYF